MIERREKFARSWHIHHTHTHRHISNYIKCVKSSHKCFGEIANNKCAISNFSTIISFAAVCMLNAKWLTRDLFVVTHIGSKTGCHCFGHSAKCKSLFKHYTFHNFSLRSRMCIFCFHLIFFFKWKYIAIEMEWSHLWTLSQPYVFALVHTIALKSVRNTYTYISERKLNDIFFVLSPAISDKINSLACFFFIRYVQSLFFLNTCIASKLNCQKKINNLITLLFK